MYIEVPSGWGWPLSSVQDWFADLAVSIWDAGVYAAEQVWSILPDWIKGAFNFIVDLATKAWDALWSFVKDPIGTLQAGFDWIVLQLNTTIAAVSTAIADVAKMVWDALPLELKDFLKSVIYFTVDVAKGLQSFIKDPIGTIQAGFDWVVAGINDYINNVLDVLSGVAQAVWNVLPDWVQNGLLFMRNIAVGLVEGAINFFHDPLGTLQKGWDWIATSVGEAAGAIKAGMEAFVGDVLSGAMRALGGALQGFMDWLMKSLMWLGEMILGAVNAVVGALGSLFTSMINGFINAITGAFGGHSPDDETSTTCSVMVQTLWERQLELIEESYPKSPTPQTVQETALAVLGGLLTVSVTSLGLAGTAELVHPIKQIFAHRTVREILWMVGVPAVMASIITMPSAVGLLTPLRYALQEQFQPNIPGAADLVRFELREVFREPFRSEQLIPATSEKFKESMRKLGYSGFWADSFWAAHWVLPSITALNEMLHRNVIDRDTWATFVRRNDFLPVMIPQLEQIIYSPYTRVDVRRMYDVRVLDEGEVKGAYMDLGYDSERAENMMLFTKIYVELPDLKARYRNGWVNQDELKQRMINMGLTVTRAEELLETIVKAEGTARVAKERDLTKSEIIKGVKAEVFTAEQGVGLLMDMGYEEWEAWYILAIQGLVELGDPESYLQMKKVTELYKKSQGKPAINVTDEWLAADKAVRDKKAEIETAKGRGESEKKLGELAVSLAHLEMRLRLQMSLKKTL